MSVANGEGGTKMKKAVAVAMALLSITVGTAYAENTYTTPILGVGNQSCGSWTQARRVGTAYADEAWVAGFLTGASAVTLQRVNIARSMRPSRTATIRAYGLGSTTTVKRILLNQ
jgi:hypothetical protein